MFYFKSPVLILPNSFTTINSYMTLACTRSSRPEVFLEKGVTEITSWYGCSPVKLQHNFRTPFPKKTFGRLLCTHCSPVEYVFSVNSSIPNLRRFIIVNFLSVQEKVYLPNLRLSFLSKSNSGQSNFWRQSRPFFSHQVSQFFLIVFHLLGKSPSAMIIFLSK